MNIYIQQHFSVFTSVFFLNSVHWNYYHFRKTNSNICHLNFSKTPLIYDFTGINAHVLFTNTKKNKYIPSCTIALAHGIEP